MTKPRSVHTAGQWLITDSGVQTGANNMEIDQRALDAMMAGKQKKPVVRFFQWDKAVITYGYLMDAEKVASYATGHGNPPIVKRPTGGGTVLHMPNDLSLSLLWPRHSGLLPDAPRECYAVIHDALRTGVRRYLGDVTLSLHAKEKSCETTPAKKFSLCFQEPVCDDVMLDKKKIIGGALRVTRQAMLYQGAIQIRSTIQMERLRNCLMTALTDTILKRVDPNARAASYLSSLGVPDES